MTPETDTSCCCCPTPAQLAGEYVHDEGQLPGQFRRTLRLDADGTFEYDRAVDLGSYYSSGTWVVVAQGGTCYVELTSKSAKGENSFTFVVFDRVLLRVSGILLTSDAKQTITFTRQSSAFPTNG